MLGSPLYSASKKFTIKTASVLPPTLYTGECRVGGRMRIVGTTSFFFFSLSHTTVLLFLLPFSWMSSVCSVCPLNLPSVFLICPSDSWLFCVIYTVLYMHKFDSHACIWYRNEVLLVIKNCAFFLLHSSKPVRAISLQIVCFWLCSGSLAACQMLNSLMSVSLVPVGQSLIWSKISLASRHDFV